MVTTSTVDPDGRYVVLEGELEGSPLALLALYDPNSNLPSFLERLSPGLLRDPNNSTLWEATLTAYTILKWIALLHHSWGQQA